MVVVFEICYRVEDFSYVVTYIKGEFDLPSDSQTSGLTSLPSLTKVDPRLPINFSTRRPVQDHPASAYVLSTRRDSTSSISSLYVRSCNTHRSVPRKEVNSGQAHIDICARACAKQQSNVPMQRSISSYRDGRHNGPDARGAEVELALDPLDAGRHEFLEGVGGMRVGERDDEPADDPQRIGSHAGGDMVVNLVDDSLSRRVRQIGEGKDK